MSAYSLEERYTLLGYFPARYTGVVHHAHFPNITFTETRALSPDSRILGEFFAAAGYTEMDFTPLQGVIDFVDRYLETGAFDDDSYDRLERTLFPLNEAMMDVTNDYIDAGLADEDGIGAPAMLFVYNDALYLLQTCHMIETSMAMENRAEMRALCNERKRNDPDPDREAVPEIA